MHNDKLSKSLCTSLAASMLNLRKSASVPVTVELTLLTAAFFFTIAFETGAFGAVRT